MTTTHNANRYANTAPRSFGCRTTTTRPDGSVSVEVGCGPNLWAVLVDVMDPFQNATDTPITMVGRYLGRF